MADSDVDPELIALLRQTLLNPQGRGTRASTGVLRSAEYIYDNAIDVSISPDETKAAAEAIYRIMTERGYSTSNWAAHELHPKEKDEATVAFIFTMDLLNFSFWSDEEGNSEEGSFVVTYKGRKWSGYWAMVACLQRALDEGIPITSPAFWRDEQALTRNRLAWIFRGDGGEELQAYGDSERSAASALLPAQSGSGVTSDIASSFANDLVNGFGTETAHDLTSGLVNGVSDSQFSDANDGPTGHIVNGVDDGAAVPYTNGVHNEEESTPQHGLANGISHVDDALAEPEFMDAQEEPATPTEPTFDGALPETTEDSQNTTDHLSTTSTAIATDHDPEHQDEHQLQPSRPTTTLEPEYTGPTIPLLDSRLQVLREAGHVLGEQFSDSLPELILSSNNSASELITLLTSHFRSFRDSVTFEGRRCNFYKRASIFVADLWACFDGADWGQFDDVNESASITVFADYRVPQILRHMGCISYSPPLDFAISQGRELPSGSDWEVQIRGCTIWCCELILRQIRRLHPDSEGRINSVLLDFFLYDLTKEKVAAGEVMLPHHRTRSIYY